MKSRNINRRNFVRSSSFAAGAMMASPLLAGEYGFNNSADDAIKVALIGCGGRGSGAATQALSTNSNVKLVAMADAFMDRLEKALTHISGAVDPSRIDVPESARFAGFDGYMKAMELADVVILTTPPGFRPMHFQEAIKQDKHVFMEKPVATDAPGIRSVLETAREAKRKKLNVVVGLQRHYQTKYTEMMSIVHKGKIGDITSAQCYWNGAGVWVRPREEGQTEMEYQMRNWYYFNWLCGDHITEQHIHNLDVINWSKNSYPVRAQGMGGREVRKGIDHGEIYDHHYVEYEYADGTILNSQCRHIKNCWNKVSESVCGTKGRADFGKGEIIGKGGKVLYKHDDRNDANPYQVEHDMLFKAITDGVYEFADADNGAHSTMTSILGRMATYSGKMIEWDDALNSQISLLPQNLSWDADPRVLPDVAGHYPIAVPGETKAV